jgi:cytoskeleton protein RodZ
MEDIGRRLRSAREGLGITLEQAEDETKIRRKYLEALETANEADIPGEVYLKGFLRTYGNYVGLDGTELVEAYKDRTGTSDRQSGAAHEERGTPPGTAGPAGATGVPVVPSGAAPQQRASPAGEPSRAAGRPGAGPAAAAAAGAVASARPRSRPAGERPRPRTGRPVALDRRTGMSPGVKLLLIAVVLLAAVAYLGWLIFRQVGPTSGPPPATKPPVPVQQPKVTDPTPKPPEPAPKPPEPAPPKVTMTRGTGEDVIFTVAAKEIQVKVEPGTRAVWLQAEVDGKTAYAATTTKPVELTGTKIRIRAGHMDGVSLTVNGQRFDKPLDAVTYNLIFNGQ